MSSQHPTKKFPNLEVLYYEVLIAETHGIFINLNIQRVYQMSETNVFLYATDIRNWGRSSGGGCRGLGTPPPRKTLQRRAHCELS